MKSGKLKLALQVLGVVAISYFVTSQVPDDNRTFKPENYYERWDDAAQFLNTLHPPGSSLDLFRYTMEQSKLKLGAENISPFEATGKREYKSCCMMTYFYTYQARFGFTGVRVAVKAEYDEGKNIVKIYYHEYRDHFGM